MFTGKNCESHISRTNSSIVPISFAIDSPIFAAGPGTLSFSNFFIYPFLQAQHQNPPLHYCESHISRTNSSIVLISFAIDSPIFTLVPGALSFSTFFIYLLSTNSASKPTPHYCAVNILRTNSSIISISFSIDSPIFATGPGALNFIFYKLSIKIPFFTTVREIQ